MYRFTTPTHEFHLSLDVSRSSELLITYSQSGRIILEKHKSDLDISDDGKTVSFKMSQTESALFNSENPVSLQVRVLTSSGDSFASPIKEVSIMPVLHNGVLGGE